MNFSRNWVQLLGETQDLHGLFDLNHANSVTHHCSRYLHLPLPLLLSLYFHTAPSQQLGKDQRLPTSLYLCSSFSPVLSLIIIIIIILPLQVTRDVVKVFEEFLLTKPNQRSLAAVSPLRGTALPK